MELNLSHFLVNIVHGTNLNNWPLVASTSNISVDWEAKMLHRGEEILAVVCSWTFLTRDKFLAWVSLCRLPQIPVVKSFTYLTDWYSARLYCLPLVYKMTSHGFILSRSGRIFVITGWLRMSVKSLNNKTFTMRRRVEQPDTRQVWSSQRKKMN